MGGEDGGGVGAHAEEAHMAEIDDAGQAVLQVEARASNT